MSGLFNLLGGSSKPQGDLRIPATKRISTPAGQRLSTILEVGNANSKGRSSVLSNGRHTPVPELFDEDGSKNSGYTTSVWSEGGEKISGLKTNKHIAKRGGWKRLVIILAILIVIIIALAVGLAVGLKKKSSKSSSTSSTSSTINPSNTGPGAPPPAPANPADFPVGSYSFVTFLDTAYTACANNSNTWTCFPYTTYYTSPASSMSVFNWNISKKPGSSDSFQISSTDNPFSVTFQNADLTLDNAGTDSEHYTFRMNMVKAVSPSAKLTDDNSAVKCFFNSTTFQAYLYTRQNHTYPTNQVTVTGASYSMWPYRARIEQVAAGGQDVPNCYKLRDGNIGDRIQGMNTTESANLCSCLYKNWNTPM